MAQCPTTPDTCKPAYAVACDPPEMVASPCHPARSSDFPDPPDPVDEPDPRETPPCVALVYASNPAEVIETFNYDESDDRYPADTSDARIIYDGVLGYLVQTGQGSYTGVSGAALSPFGTFCNTAGDVVTTIPCEKFTPTGSNAECVKVVSSSSGETLQEFAFNDQFNVYEAPNGQTIAIDPLTDNWHALLNTTYEIEGSGTSATGIYCDASGNYIAVVSCDKN